MTARKVVGPSLLLVVVVAVVVSGLGTPTPRRNSKYLSWDTEEDRDQGGPSPYPSSSSSSSRGDRKLVFINNKAYDLTEAEESRVWELYLKKGHVPGHTEGWKSYTHMDSLEAAMMLSEAVDQNLDTNQRPRDQEDTVYTSLQDVGNVNLTQQENKDNSQSAPASENVINERLQENTDQSKILQENKDQSQILQENTDQSQVLQVIENITQRLQDNKDNLEESQDDGDASHKVPEDSNNVQTPHTDDNHLKELRENIKMSRFVADPEKLKLVQSVDDQERQELYNASTTEAPSSNSADEKVEVTEVHYEATKVDPLTFIWRELLNLGEALGRELIDTVSARLTYLWNSVVRFVQARGRRAIRDQSWDL